MRGNDGDARALGIMRRAAAKAGLVDIEFEYEPLAAAYKYERSIDGECNLLVVDIGGGTTDCAMVRVGPARAGKRDRRDDVLGVAGDRIGGTDFDEALAWQAIMPAFGKGSMLTSGRPVPHSLLHDAISIRDLPAQQRFASSRHVIRDLVRESASPDRLERFGTLHSGQLQHRLVHGAEMAKIALSERQECKVPLGYVDPQLVIDIDRDLFTNTTARLIARVQGLTRETMASAGVRPDVFMTGGMAASPLIVEAVKQVVGPEVPVRFGDMLESVGQGLALCAQQSLRQ